MRISDKLNSVMATIDRILQQAFPECDAVLIVIPKDRPDAICLSTVKPDDARKIAQAFIESDANWHVGTAEGHNVIN